MTEYIDITPTWEEILPTWLKIAEFAYSDTLAPAAPSQIRAFGAEMLNMARAADKWNAHCKGEVK